jgi:hypothetical protein
VLKGDLPIGVDKRSVDTWMEVRPAVACVIVNRPKSNGYQLLGCWGGRGLHERSVLNIIAKAHQVAY